MHDYRERLRVPLAWWLLAVPSVLILGATLYAGLAEPWPIIIMAGLLAGCAIFLIALGLAAIEVRDGAVRAGNAALPLTAVSEVVTLDENQTARLRGPRADPAAHLYSRPYLKESVYLAVAPSGPATPYWLIGTRHPAGAGRRHRKVPGAGWPRASGMMARTRVAGEAKEAVMVDSDKKEDIGTRVFNAMTMMAAGFVARKAITLAWTKVTGKKPPVNPEDPGVAFVEALAWSVLTGVTVAAFRLLAIRAVARKALGGADRESVNAADGQAAHSRQTS